MNHSGDTGKMVSDTPRTETYVLNPLPQVVSAEFSRELERELNAANERIKRLEEAGDKMAEWLENPRNLGADACLSHAWREAKEAKL